MNQGHMTRLRYEREQRGWSRSYIAEKIEVDIATVGRWERGERLPHPYHRQKLCALFGKNAHELGFTEHSAEYIQQEPTPMQNVSGELKRTQQSQLEMVNTPCSPTAANEEPVHQPPSTTSPPTPTIHTYDAVPEQQQKSHTRRQVLIGIGGTVIAATAAFTGINIIRSLGLFSTQRILLKTYQNPPLTNWVNNIAWSPQAKYIAAANNKNMLIAWNTQSATEFNDFNIGPVSSWSNDVSWSSDNLIASANVIPIDQQTPTGNIRVWQPLEAQALFTINSSYPMRTVCWSPNSTMLAFGGHATTVTISDNQGKTLLSFDIPSIGAINRIKWSSNSKYLAVACDNGVAYVYEIATKKIVQSYHGHAAKIYDLVWEPEGTRIASASMDKTAQVWDAFSGQLFTIYKGHRQSIHCIDWSHDGKYIVTGGEDNTAQVWSATVGTHIYTYHENSNVLTVIWFPDGQSIALGTASNGLHLWQA
jgi:WD40 repeat protein/transcriptional regulator with XRE-family HTH domain